MLTVADLIAHLLTLPQEARVMVDGYEGGVKDITLGHVALHEVLLNYRSTGDLMSEHERVEDWCDPDDLVRCKRVSTVIVSRWQRDLPVKVAQ